MVVIDGADSLGVSKCEEQVGVFIEIPVASRLSSKLEDLAVGRCSVPRASQQLLVVVSMYRDSHLSISIDSKTYATLGGRTSLNV